MAAIATTQANTARDGANNAAESATNLVNTYATDLAAKELKDNKQNSLAPDGTGTKFPTVGAVNEGLGLKANKVQEEWITPTLLNGWVAEPGYDYGYMKDDFGFVHFKGRFKSGTIAQPLFVLPIDYRPQSIFSFGYAVISDPKLNGYIRVNKNTGEVTPNLDAGNTYVIIDALIYKAQ